MKVVLFHPALLPPRDYGGVERVVMWLAKGLLEEGAEPWVAALEGSQLPEGVNLIPMKRESVSAWDLLDCLPGDADFVHFMAPPEEGVLDRLQTPSILTVHGNAEAGKVYPLNSVFLSQDHAQRNGAESFVYNGIDPSEFEFSSEPRPQGSEGQYLFLSRTQWSVKNVRGAMRLCRATRSRLRIAGGHRPFLARLRASMSPLFHWEGPVGGDRKARVLRESRALLFPILWPEPFGLVVAEALMSGTPVIANPRGSLPELVNDEVGALPETEDAWKECLTRDRLPWEPKACRNRAEKMFHYRVMARSYLQIYERVRGGESLNAKPPTAPEWRSQ